MEREPQSNCLSLSEVEPLLLALSEGRGRLRLAALRALVCLPLEEPGWVAIARTVMQELAAVQTGSTELPLYGLFEAAARLPVGQVRAMLRGAVQQASGDLREAGVCALAAAGDPEAIPYLLCDPPATADRAVWARLPTLVDEGCRAALLERLRQLEGGTAEVLEQRWWAALALARLGDDAPLRRVFVDITGDPDSFPYFWGDPGWLESKLRRLGPFAAPVEAWLREFAESEAVSGRVAELASWLLEGEPLAQPPEEPLPRPEPASEAMRAAALAEAARLLARSAAGEDCLSRADTELLGALDLAQASRFLVSLLGLLGERGFPTPVPVTAGNAVVELSHRLDWRVLPGTEELVGAYRRVRRRSRVVAAQLGWLVGRCGPQVLRELARLFASQPSARDRIAAAQLLEDVCVGLACVDPPVFGSARGLFVGSVRYGGPLGNEAEALAAHVPAA